MANYTFNGSLTMTANSATGYSQTQSASFTLNLTGINQIESGRADIAHDGDYGLDASAFGASTTETTTLRADTATVHVEYFFFEVDSAA